MSKPLLRCPTCGFSVLVHEDGWPPDRIGCLNCDWRGTAGELTKPRRHRSHVGPPTAVVIGTPPRLESPAGGTVPSGQPG